MTYDLYISRLNGASKTAAFRIQGEACIAFLNDDLSICEYADIYHRCEKIMGPYCNAL